MIIVPIKNFTEKELKCKCCGLLNIDEEFFIRLQAFRYLLGKPLTVTSACRCKKHNKEEGGVDTSCHVGEGKKCTAIDVTNSECGDIYEQACLSGLFNEVIWYKSKRFVHLGLDRKQKCKYYEVKN